MRPIEKVIKNIDEKKKKTTPFYKENKVEKLKLLCIIVNKNQSDFFVNKLIGMEVSAVFTTYGKGTATKEVYDYIGLDSKKELVMALVKESMYEDIKKLIETRFSVSELSKGISFTIPLDSMVGVIMYKFLTNSR